MWKWIGYGVAAIVGIVVTKKVIDEFSEPTFESGYKDGRSGKPSTIGCHADTLDPNAPLSHKRYCEGWFKGVTDRKLAAGV